MINVNYDITGIEGALFSAVKSAANPTVVYPSRRPTSIPNNMDSFIVVRSVTEVVDKTAFGTNICRIEVYVKSKGGVKDAATMSSIVKKIFAALPIVADKYRFTYLSNIPIGLDNTGYDVEAININALIK